MGSGKPLVRLYLEAKKRLRAEGKGDFGELGYANEDYYRVLEEFGDERRWAEKRAAEDAKS